MSKHFCGYYINALTEGKNLEDTAYELSVLCDSRKRAYGDQHVFAQIIQKMLAEPEDSKEHRAATAFLTALQEE